MIVKLIPTTFERRPSPPLESEEPDGIEALERARNMDESAPMNPAIRRCAKAGQRLRPACDIMDKSRRVLRLMDVPDFIRASTGVVVSRAAVNSWMVGNKGRLMSDGSTGYLPTKRIGRTVICEKDDLCALLEMELE